MIVVLISVMGLAIWTYLFWIGLKRLRAERLTQEKRPWFGDMYRLSRNKRAVAMFALWSLVASYTLTTAQYINLDWIEFSRIVGVSERVIIIVCGLWIWLGPGDRLS
jgi:hypothetical protein